MKPLSLTSICLSYRLWVRLRYDSADRPKVQSRRELHVVRPINSSPLCPSLSRLSPVPTLSWNGTAQKQHPCSSVAPPRTSGEWHNEPDPWFSPHDLMAPLSDGPPMSPGSFELGRSNLSQQGGLGAYMATGGEDAMSMTASSLPVIEMRTHPESAFPTYKRRFSRAPIMQPPPSKGDAKWMAGHGYD